MNWQIDASLPIYLQTKLEIVYIMAAKENFAQVAVADGLNLSPVYQIAVSLVDAVIIAEVFMTNDSQTLVLIDKLTDIVIWEKEIYKPLIDMEYNEILYIFQAVLKGVPTTELVSGRLYFYWR